MPAFFTGKFWMALAVLLGVVGIQALLAWADGWLTQSQLQSSGITNGYALMEHGGWLADLLLISPLGAYIIASYRLPCLSWQGVLIFAGALAAGLVLGRMWQEFGKTYPEAYTHGGITTPAGVIHLAYLVGLVWIIGMYYFAPTNPHHGYDMFVVATGITVLSVLGLWKFSPAWHFGLNELGQSAGLSALVWLVTAWKLRAL